MRYPISSLDAMIDDRKSDLTNGPNACFAEFVMQTGW